jgi:hypothetical protein
VVDVESGSPPRLLAGPAEQDVGDRAVEPVEGGVLPVGADTPGKELVDRRLPGGPLDRLDVRASAGAARSSRATTRCPSPSSGEAQAKPTSISVWSPMSQSAGGTMKETMDVSSSGISAVHSS